jgi:hypothetical protein
MNLRRSFAALLFLAALAPASALAQVSDADKGTARELTLQGYDALKNNDYAAAADRFARADSLYHAPTITLGLARARAGLGKLVSAQELYSRVAHETVPADASASFTNAVEDAKRELVALTPRLPGVVINVKGADGAKVTLDGTDVPSAAWGVRRPADPGEHVVRALAVGFSPVEVKVTLVEGKAEAVTLELKPGPGGPAALPLAGAPTVAPAGGPAFGVTPLPGLPPDQPDTSGPTRRLVGFVGIGLGGVGIIVGAATGGLAASKHSSIAAQCTNGTCPISSMSTIQPQINNYDTLGTISTVGIVAGAALAVTGVILVATAPRAAKRASITPLIGLGYAGAQGSF